MTLPTSGPISLADIKAEFGGNTPYKLSDYYAGGSFVQSGATGTNGAVPTSGVLRMDGFYGTSHESAISVSIADASGSIDSPSTTATVTAGTTLVPSGGSGVYSTYSSVYKSGDNTISSSGTTTATPSFSKSISAAQQSTTTVTAVWTGTVTDSEGHSTHQDFNVTLEHSNTSG